MTKASCPTCGAECNIVTEETIGLATGMMPSGNRLCTNHYEPTAEARIAAAKEILTKYQGCHALRREVLAALGGDVPTVGPGADALLSSAHAHLTDPDGPNLPQARKNILAAQALLRGEVRLSR